MAALVGIAVWLQSVVGLLAPKDQRFPLMTLEWPEEQARKRRGYAQAKAEKAAGKAAVKAYPS